MAANDSVHISFDNGDFGSIGNVFNVDTSISGQVTLGGDGAAMMEWATGADAGHGYGTYTVVAKVDGNQPGPAILLWPSDNLWPGHEIDMMEITPDGSGRQYGALHWDGGGYDSYDARIHDGVAGGSWHTYQAVWEPGKLTMSVDGKVTSVFTDHVPADAAHGGGNVTIGAMNINPNTSVTIDDVRYDPLYADAPAATTASAPVETWQPDTSVPTTDAVATVDAAAAVGVAADVTTTGGATDWDALAAQVTANHAATGSWFI